jgi:inner membrane protein
MRAPTLGGGLRKATKRGRARDRLSAHLESSRRAGLAVGGAALCAAETLAPGAFFLWIGAAAAIVGAIAYFVAMSLIAQALLFGALVVALVLTGRRVYGSLDLSPGPLPQSRAHALIGADFFLDEAIVRGYGRTLVARRRRRLPTRRQGSGRRGRGRRSAPGEEGVVCAPVSGRRERARSNG